MIVGASQGLLLAIAIGKMSGLRDRARLILSAIVAFFSLGIIADIVMHLFYDKHLIHQSFIGMFFLLFGPSIYLYIKAMTGQKTRHTFLHFAPYVTGLISMASFSYIFPGQDEVIIHIILSAIIVVQAAYYVVKIIKSFRLYSAQINNNFSSVERIDLLWLRFLTGCFFGSLVVVCVIEFILSGEHRWNYFWLYISFVIYSIGYIGLTRPSAFSSETVPEEVPSASEINSETIKPADNSGTFIESRKYRKTALADEKIEDLSSRLEIIMNEEKIYLEPELSMPGLAARISAQPHHLSQVINEKYRMNFFEYINRKRIDYAERAISDTDPEDVNITRIAFDSGFNSISSFNSAFKRFTGITPSAFREKMKNRAID